jgi:hypothetical protein
MSMVRIPGLGFFKGGAGSASDVAVGAVAGLIGVGAIKFVVNKWLADKVPSIVMRGLPALSGAITAGALYYGQKKSSKAKSHALGALTVGLAINVWDEVRAAVPQLADLVSVRLDSYRGMLVDDRGGLNGMLIDDNSASARNLNDLNAINMQPDDDD